MTFELQKIKGVWVVSQAGEIIGAANDAKSVLAGAAKQLVAGAEKELATSKDETA